jgi:hypothetical protein
MFVKYLADAKDFAKGYLFGHFRSKGLMSGPTVLPLFTGVKPEQRLNERAQCGSKWLDPGLSLLKPGLHHLRPKHAR